MLDNALPVGTLIKNDYRNYRIDRVLGSGGFGITYLGYCYQTDRLCAIKEFFIAGKCVRDTNLFVSFQQASAPLYQKFRDRFLQEAKMVHRLQHSNIVKVLDIISAYNTIYMVMEFIEGCTLRKKVEKSGPLPYTLAINYIGQLSSAVEYCHNINILHRDIKPDNVMITPDDRAILIDFGSARSFINDSIQQHTTLVTPGYAPIEQYSSTSKKGCYTDIYAIGGTFYYAITGKVPTPATDRVTGESLPYPSSFVLGIPKEAENTIIKALAIKVEDRFQTINDFQESLFGISPQEENTGGLGVQNIQDSENSGSFKPTPKPSKLKGWQVVLIIIASLICLISFVIELCSD